MFAPAISDPDFPGQIMRALDQRGLPPSALTVEITEDLLVDNMGRARLVFNKLRDKGIRVAIDDFGSGYSALWYLREFPVDEVKLAKEFIAPILTHPASAAIVRAVIDLAHALGVTPVAEGVENAETAALLAGIRVRGRAGLPLQRDRLPRRPSSNSWRSQKRLRRVAGLRT